jgi:putative ABC transport system permease protein
LSASWSLFQRLVVRPLLGEPLRTALTLLAVALGVAVVIAIDLAGQSAAGSFHSSVESLSGTGDYILRSAGGFNEQLLGRLVRLPYPFKFVPRIEDFAFVDGHGEAIPFIGLDLVGEASTAPIKTSTPTNFSEKAIWVSKELHLRQGDAAQLLINDKMERYQVAGVLPNASGGLETGPVIVADIGVAQRGTGKIGRLDVVTATLPHTLSEQDAISLLRRTLPASVAIEPRGARTDENRKMLAAFRWNLRVLSYIALLVGAFLIYNTVSISVVRRRTDIGVLKALGATRHEVLVGVLGEALCFAIAGSLLGVLLGRVMASFAVQLVGTTVHSLYVTSRSAPVQLSLRSLLTGAGLGCIVSLVAAIAPAFEAARVPPTEAMARGRRDYVIKERTSRLLLGALISYGVAGVLSLLPAVGNQPVFAYGAVLLLVAGTSALIPAVVRSFAGLSIFRISPVLQAEALLSTRALRGSIGRASVLIAALATAVAMTASVGIMVGSFRETVSVWMNNQLKADFYLRPAGEAAADRHPTMSVDIANAIERLPGVAAVDRFRAYPITYEGVPATLAGGEDARVANSPSTRFLPGEDRAQILRTLPQGDYAIISEPFANKHHLGPGSFVQLPLAGRIRPFRVLGIYYDYSTERGFIVLDRNTLLKYLPDPAISNAAVFLRPGADPHAVRAAIGQVISRHAVLVFANAELRRGAIQIFDRTFSITYALEAVAIFVAVTGIAGAMLALILDRRREFALLRFLGGSEGQIRRIVLCEAGIFGLLANAIGIVLGTLLSLILIFVINKQSFGWTIQFHWPVAMLLLVLSGIYAATILAGLYPAQIAVGSKPIEVIHEE